MSLFHLYDCTSAPSYCWHMSKRALACDYQTIIFNLVCYLDDSSDVVMNCLKQLIFLLWDETLASSIPRTSALLCTNPETYSTMGKSVRHTGISEIIRFNFSDQNILNKENASSNFTSTGLPKKNLQKQL